MTRQEEDWARVTKERVCVRQIRDVAPWSGEFPCHGAWNFVLSLAGSFIFEGPTGAPLLVGPGDLVVVTNRAPAANDGGNSEVFRVYCEANAQASSAFRVNEPNVEIFCAAVAEPVEQGSVPARCTFELRAETIAADLALSRAVTLLRLELAEPQQRSSRTLEKLSELVLAYAIRCRFDQRTTSSGALARSGACSKQVLRALALMHEDPARRWTIQQLAKASGLSRSALARRFMDELGAPPVHYLTELRLRRAAELLVSSEGSLAEIARHVGYDSEFAFSRAFKRHHGVPPGLYRRRAVGASPRTSMQQLRAAA